MDGTSATSKGNQPLIVPSGASLKTLGSLLSRYQAALAPALPLAYAESEVERVRTLPNAQLTPETAWDDSSRSYREPPCRQ